MKNVLNAIQTQRIVNNILEVACNFARMDYDVLKLMAKFEKASEYPAVSLELLRNDVRLDASGMKGDFADLEVIRSLRELMKDENGNSWTSFVLTYEKGGQANIKYDYSPLPEE